MQTNEYEGGCHCGDVKFKVETDISQCMTCNCSHCSVKGFILNFVTPEKFTLLSGEDKLKEYRFNTHKIAHLFCVHCGVGSFAYGENAKGEKMIMINVRSLAGVELNDLNPSPFNGRDLM